MESFSPVEYQIFLDDLVTIEQIKDRTKLRAKLANNLIMIMAALEQAAGRAETPMQQPTSVEHRQDHRPYNIGPSDRAKPHVPNRADMDAIADETLAVISRDWGKPMDDRLRAVLKHWMVATMTEVRNKTLNYQEIALRVIADAMQNQRLV